MTDFFNLPSKAGQDTQNQYLSQIAQHLGVTAGNLQDAINMANQANQAATAKITDLETRFQTLTAEQQQDSEVIDARMGKVSLRANLESMNAALAEHQADNVNDADGVHGFKTESGTFTPKIVGLTVEGSNTYTKNIGFYSKQGNLVNVSIAISMSAKDAALSGALAVSGLPFSAVFEAEYYAVPSISWGGILLSAGRTQISGYLGGGGTAIVLQQCGAGLQALLMDQTNLTDTSELTITLTYRV